MTQVYLICWRSGVERWWICETTNPAALKGVAHKYKFVTWLDGPGRLPTYVDMTLLIFMSEASAIVRFVITRPSHTRSPFISGCPQHPLALWWWCAWMLLMRRCLGPNPPVTGKPERRGCEGLGSMSLSFNDRLPDHCCNVISCQFVCSRETEEWRAATMMQGKNVTRPWNSSLVCWCYVLARE